MKFLSLFSGIGGFDLGLERAGMECVGQCDNDPFCNKVLEKHWPEVRRFGDVRDITGGGATDWASLRATVDLVCGGFPCQDLSVAGKRLGLVGDRSGLWFEFKRVLSELRPRWAIIENVPGLLSSDGGRDFAIVLAGLEQCGFGGISWAVLDSQFFGVPQRRRRVYVVAGPSRRCTEQVLSICEGGDWYPPTRREAGKDVASTLRAGANCTGGDRPPGTDVDTVETLQVVANTLSGHHPRLDLDNDTYVTTGKGWWREGLPSLTAHDEKQSEGALTVIQDARGVRNKAQNGIGITENADVMYTLDGTSQHAFQQRAAVRRLTPVEAERLQGFPDDWTKVDDKMPDGPRYKACGNAVTVPVIEYLGLRIAHINAGETP